MSVLQKNIRDSNLELLRILSMILIIIHHYSVHGGFYFADATLTFNKVFVQILSLGGKIGVICFILITGYFMIKSSFKFRKLLKLILEILFYSIGIFAIFCIFGLTNFDTSSLISYLFPITHSVYWFATVYVVLYIFTPFINKLLTNLSQKMYLVLLLLLFILCSLIPTFILGTYGFSNMLLYLFGYSYPVFSLGVLGISNIGMFIFIYMTAAYIRLYPKSFKGLFIKTSLNLFLAIGLFCLMILSVIIFDVLGMIFDIFTRDPTYFMSITSPLALICGVFLLLGFKNLKIQNKAINQIALSMFGVYLIHDNPLVRSFLWQNIFQNSLYANSVFLVPHACFAIGITFIVCIIFDQTRIAVIEKPLFIGIDKVTEKIKPSIDSVKNKINSIVSKYIL